MDRKRKDPLAFLVIFVAYTCLLSLSVLSSHVPNSLIGVHPLDEKYYASEVIKCKDGSKSFPRDRMNDDYCDCPDGTDEPGTSACPDGKFYCRNVGSTPHFLFSSRVNDHFCDCCDGSDEYDGAVICPNTCVMGGNIVYKTSSYSSKIRDLGSVDPEEKDAVQKHYGLETMIILQVVIIVLAVVLRIFFKRAKSRRRHFR